MKFLKYFCIIASLFAVTTVVFADVTQFVFFTSPQSIPVGTLSAVITIQSQDSTGSKLNIPNTMYVTVTSSSPTGEFFSNTSGSALDSPVTMAKNSANKNFYYQDSTAGTYTIQVAVASVKGGPTLFSASQQIVIGGDSSSSN